MHLKVTPDVFSEFERCRLALLTHLQSCDPEGPRELLAANMIVTNSEEQCNDGEKDDEGSWGSSSFGTRSVDCDSTASFAGPRG